MSSVRLEMISAAWSIPIRRELGAKMKPKASAPAAMPACASGKFVIAQIFTQIIGLPPPVPAALAMRLRDARRALAIRQSETHRIQRLAGWQYHRQFRYRSQRPSLLREASTRPVGATYSGQLEKYAGSDC